jgi:ABC-type branched-subunit amino acid transport system ATPase component
MASKEENFMNILETGGLYHDFKGLEVLFDVNLQVEEGERQMLTIGRPLMGKAHIGFSCNTE